MAKAAKIQTPRRNGIAGSLSNACFRKRVEKPKKGRGSYSRKGKSAYAYAQAAKPNPPRPFHLRDRP